MIGKGQSNNFGKEITLIKKKFPTCKYIMFLAKQKKGTKHDVCSTYLAPLNFRPPGFARPCPAVQYFGNFFLTLFAIVILRKL